VRPRALYALYFTTSLYALYKLMTYLRSHWCCSVVPVVLQYCCYRLLSYQLAATRLLLQACANDTLPADVAEAIENISRQSDGWMAYKIGRQAARFSHHSLAANIFTRLTQTVSVISHHSELV